MASSATIDALARALVARFLRTNNYADTLQAFLREADLPPDVGQTSGDDTNNWTIQSLLEEKRTFDHSVNFERYGRESREHSLWSIPGEYWLQVAKSSVRVLGHTIHTHVRSSTDSCIAPSKPTIIQTPTPSNLLAASVESWQSPRDENGADLAAPPPVIVSAGADRQVHLLETTAGNAVITSFSGLSDSPVLSYVSILGGRYIFMTNMSGHLLLQRGHRIVDSRKDHSKYAVKVVAHEQRDESDSSKTCWIATAGWDATVYLYRIDTSNENHDILSIGNPIARIKTATNPESLLFVRHVDSNELFLLVSRRDSTHIYYYQVETPRETTSTPGETTSARPSIPEAKLLGHQNLAPHSNAWIAFSPAHMALSPHDPGLLAVATSTLPHLKVLIVRLLFPSVDATAAVNTPSADVEVTQASQALAALALQNREDAAILVQANTFAPQTAYSTPQVAWRPDGSGVWVNGDDGVVRGVEATTGKVVALLKNGHETGCKVRTIWAGYVDVRGEGDESIREEWVISGGFDKRLIIWKV